VTVCDCVSPDAVAEQVSVVVPVNGPKVAGVTWVAKGEPLAVQDMIAPDVADDTTGDTELGNVSAPGLRVGVATTPVAALNVYVEVAEADGLSPDAVAEQTNTVVAVNGPNVAGLAAGVRFVPLAAQAIVAPDVVDDTTGETEALNVSLPGLKVGVATVGVLVWIV
jgi:hypothetical protein